MYSSLSGPTDCISRYVRTYLGTFSLAFYGTCVESGPTQFYDFLNSFLVIDIS